MKSSKRPGGGNIGQYPGPDSDPLFYACFECPYEDCRYDQSDLKKCPFRTEWGMKHDYREQGYPSLEHKYGAVEGENLALGGGERSGFVGSRE
jgi:hypothetical protein